ncbi:unnamed protein product [Didymodactylos carnosus]|uniref:Uncharacterized protein n=1 Tax=Didymodactylos carnosus TaxID=1234261 RepID=A0A815UZS3_9BILA|nr:unnamed protein product [Didymodactylos carnosus]CAF1521011.1 unnamed protein product [Didymodactylos carnosus]CAF3739575.1 unnamed protein product [Didymodactylos carnosus]CAF4380377.1 unnamed protein product [Didymodactylos carnosus]
MSTKLTTKENLSIVTDKNHLENLKLNLEHKAMNRREIPLCVEEVLFKFAYSAADDVERAKIVLAAGCLADFELKTTLKSTRKLRVNMKMLINE